MHESVSIQIPAELFARLQQLAVPLVDDVPSLLRKLADHWEAKPGGNSSARATGTPSVTSTATRTPSPAPDVWKSGRGDVLRVGAELKGECLGKAFSATVEANGLRFEGGLYESLSAAAVAAKELLGRTGRAASMNGRTFWKIRDPKSGRWIAVAALRPKEHIDTDALFAELDALATNG